jgi:hypothetical protein
LIRKLPFLFDDSLHTMILCRFCQSKNPEGSVACRMCGVPLSLAPVARGMVPSSPVPLSAPVAVAVASSSVASRAITLEQLASERGGCLSEREAIAYILRVAKSAGDAFRAQKGQAAGCPALLRARMLRLDPTGRVVFVEEALIEGLCASEFQLARQLAIVLVELLSGVPVPFQHHVPEALVLQAVAKCSGAQVQAALNAAFGDQVISLSTWLAMLRAPQKAGKPMPAAAPAGMSRVPSPLNATSRDARAVRRATPVPAANAARSAAVVRSGPVEPGALATPAPFRIGTLSPLRRIGAGEHRFIRLAFGPDGKEVWSADDQGLVQVWSTVTGSNLARLDTRFRGGGQVTALSFAVNSAGQSTLAPENAELVASGHDDGRLRVWDVRANKLRKVIDAHDARVDALSFSTPGGVLLHLISGGSDGALVVWDALAGRRLHLIREDSHIIKVLAASPSGREVGLGGDDGRVEVWSAGAQRRLWSTMMHEFWVTALTVSPNARIVASGGYDCSTRLWAAATGAELHRLSGHQTAVSGVAFGPDNRVLATAGADGTVRVWDAWTAQAGPVLSDMGGAVNAVAWSPGGRVLATASDTSIMLWRRDA